MPEENRWEPPAARVLELLRAGRADDAWAYLDRAAASGEAGEPSVPGPAAGFREVGGLLYWQHKALPEFVQLQEEQIRRYEAALAGCQNPEARARLVRPLGGAYYNLASFTWPGWAEEEGPPVTPEQARALWAIGRRAAQQCLAIREDPANSAAAFGYTPGMAHWVVGAHRLAAGDYPGARESFRRERELDLAAGEDAALSTGYAALAELLEKPEDGSARAAFDAVIAELQGRGDDEDARFIRDQLLTARRIFLKLA